MTGISKHRRVAPALQATQARLQRQMTKDKLSQKLAERPDPWELSDAGLFAPSGAGGGGASPAGREGRHGAEYDEDESAEDMEESEYDTDRYLRQARY